MADRTAPDRLDTLRDRIDDAGSLMPSGSAASAIGYVKNIRNNT
ncbi:hypothetical protein [Streptomyces nitrosporeus]|nr:hypothetical protein [Streptomyces nitrosporeus]